MVDETDWVTLGADVKGEIYEGLLFPFLSPSIPSLDSMGFVRYNCYALPMRFKFDRRKSEELRLNPKRGIGFDEAQEIFTHPYYGDCRSDDPEQFRAIGWVEGRLYSLIYEIREDEDGEYYHQVTLWKSTREEKRLNEESS